MSAPTTPPAVPLARTTGEDGRPRLVEPELRRVDGAVREAAVPPFAPPAATGSLADIPFDNAREAPDEAVLSRKDEDGRFQDLTAAEFAAEVLALAKGLAATGLEPGDRLAIMARTTYEWTLLDFAAWAAGLVTVPVYPTSSAFQTRWILQNAGVKALAVESAEQAAALGPERDRLPDLAHLWSFATSPKDPVGDLGRLKEAGGAIPDEEITRRRTALTPQTTATLIYTSGTTGRPKGCVLTHGNFFAEVDNAVELLHPVFKSVSREPASTLLFLPLSHVFGRMVAIGCLRARVRLGHAPSIRTEDLLADLAAFRPTFLLAIPYVLEKVFNTGRATAEKMGRAASFDRAARIARAWGEATEAQQHGTGPGPGLGLRTARALYDPLVYRRVRAALGGRVRYAICGGSPLGRRLAAFYAGAGIEIFEGYGLTETTAAAVVTPPLKPRLGTVGWPLPGGRVRIADDGEVLLGGGHVFSGYWDAETGEVTRGPVDGWFPTGDLGALDEDGYLTITGRKKDILITTGGKNVAPAPLEDWLRAHPLVGQCMVVGDDRPYITALLTLEPEGIAHWRRMRRKEALTAAELARDPELLEALQKAVDDANKLVSRAESIRRFTVLPVDLTEEAGHLTPSLKIKRPAVEQAFAEEIEALYRK
ncbi:long-chain fatty acid--CoA ligase [Streptomyces sp. TSRI0384-2]|uniref:AMP-dependent synthetase/ligase n=1 Tax=Streptomyces TaxID=1883 RepID=UPI000C2686E2|nr:AMP-dependent synthetase/ligase [Streptomyces sp. TSRI0384-2]NEE42802.1 AMP-binding protein [Streptomyces sp. SID7982]PJM84488.1 long-chain fatty acid--CoA ligase [Streptomyces sp. TSRI0384-2]